ncbi:MAG: HDIG domain-containing protein [archaeon]|nr:HDIG domain-containing protein [archaeon]
MVNYDDDDLNWMVTEEYIPSKTEVIDKLIQMNLQRNIINHVKAVSRKAIKMATTIQTIKVDLKLVRIGALLHDIGRVETHDFNHAVVGGKIIRELGYSEKLAKIAETHILGGLTKEEAIKLNLPTRDFMPITIEEKIICLADKYHIGDKKVTIEQRFRNWFNRFGETELLLKAKQRAELLELEIYRMMYP